MSHNPDASMEGCVGVIYNHLTRSILKLILGHLLSAGALNGSHD